MRTSVQRTTALAVVALFVMTILPSAEAQVPPPPMPPNTSLQCGSLYFPILDWVDDCLPSFILAPWAIWIKQMDLWLRCEILGGAAC